MNRNRLQKYIDRKEDEAVNEALKPRICPYCKHRVNGKKVK